MSDPVYLYGKNPLKEVLLLAKRIEAMPIEKLYITKDAEKDSELISLIQSNKLNYEIVTKEEIESFVGRGTLNQGICARLNENMLYKSLEEVLGNNENRTSKKLYVLLDELQDPHNVGAIIRSAAAFGVDALLVPTHNQVLINATVIKASSGMAFVVPIVKIGNVNTVIEKLKEKGFWTYGLTGGGDTKLADAKFDTNTLLIAGNEGDGIKQKTLEVCDFRVSIETNQLCESLNVSNAVAVALYEWRGQQKKII